MAIPTTVEDFLELGHKSGVLDKAGCDTYLQQKREAEPLPEAPRQLADQMVQDGLLTQFQADQLLQGKWRNFLIAGKYKLLDRLGAGGMGSVFLCEHKIMRRRVALKVLPPAQADNTASLERFRREARAGAHLDHPNIVKTHDIDQDNKLHFLVMEYVEGTSLHHLVTMLGKLDILRASHYIRQAACGLEHAHEAGLIHRDIKPANLLLDRNGTIKILDMGVARFFNDLGDNLTQEHDSRAVLGTADFLSPEQAVSSHDVDIRADIYSLGVTFYFLLTGDTPFAEGTLAQKLIWHQLREPRPLHDFRPDVPEELAAVISKMMAKDRADRYQTPQEVMEALAPWTETPIPPPSEEEMPRRSPNAPRGENGKSTVRPRSSTGNRASGVGVSGKTPLPTRNGAGLSARTLTAGRPTGPWWASKDRRWLWIAIGGGGAGAAVLTLFVFFFLGSSSGTLVVILDPGIELRISGEGRELLVAEAQNKQRLPLKPGKYQVVATKPGANVQIDPSTFTLAGGAETTVRAWLPAQPPSQQGGGSKLPFGPAKVPDPSLPPPPVKEITRFTGHTDAVNSVAFSPDGKLALSGSSDNTARLWDVEKGQEIRQLQGHTGPVLSVSFSTNGRYALTASADKTVRLWDVASAQELRRFEGHQDEVLSAALSPDSRRMISGSRDETAILWDVDSTVVLYRLTEHHSVVRSVAYAPDAPRALTAGYDTAVRLWDTGKGSEVRRCSGHPDRVTCVTFSPEGRMAVSGGFDKVVRVWDVASGQELRNFEGHTDPIWSVAFSPDGRRVASASGRMPRTDEPSDRTVRLWDLEEGVRVHTFQGHEDAVLGVAFSPDGRFLLSASTDKTVRLWGLPMPGVETSALSDGLMGWWKLDEGTGSKVSDSSGNNRHGTIEGQLAWTAGKLGGALSANGVTTDGVKIPNDDALRFNRSQSFSVAAWIEVPELPATGTWHGIVSKSREAGNWYGIWINPQNQWSFCANGEGNDLLGSTVTPGWHHVVITQNSKANVRRIYVDGANVSTRGAPPIDGDGAGELWLGTSHFGNENFKGKVDDVRIYDRALNNREIKDLAEGKN